MYLTHNLHGFENSCRTLFMIAHIKNTMNTSCGPYWHMVYRLQLQFISTCGGID